MLVTMYLVGKIDYFIIIVKDVVTTLVTINSQPFKRHFA